MNKTDLKKQNPSIISGEWVSLGKLMNTAFSGMHDAEKAKRILRTTYEKEQYAQVFPKSICRREARPILHEDSQRADFRIRDTLSARVFVRNLWFIHQFLPRPRDVMRFLTTTKSGERQKMFEQRFEELKALANTYTGWLKVSGGISQKLEDFSPTKTDLLAVSEVATASPEATISSPTSLGSAAAADLIREVEQRASYQAGNPDDASEKALYFLALGRPDIGQTIASEVLAENPDHAVALYANAVLLLDASERHQRQSFIHDIMHPHDLEPIEAEEFYHADCHAKESMQAWEKESQAFLLMLKARQNWPKRFQIRCYELSPDMWQHKVEEWILQRAALRMSKDSSELSLPRREDAETALKTLRWIIADIWKVQGRSFFSPIWFGGLGRFIIVAAHVHKVVARTCLNELEAALERTKLHESDLIWREYDMELPISQEPTLAETLIPAVKDFRFCLAVFAMRPMAEAANLLRRVTHAGLSDELDRRTVLRSLTMREVVLSFVRNGCLIQAIELCREMVERSDWPATKTGEKLHACWRYAQVYLHFESSRAAFEMNDLPAAAQQAVQAIQLAANSIDKIAGEKPLLTFIDRDEDAALREPGDFLCGRPNIATDTSPADFFPSATRWNPLEVGHKPYLDDFVKWSQAELHGDTSLLLAYGLWLSKKHGQGESLLSICDGFAAKLSALKL